MTFALLVVLASTCPVPTSTAATSEIRAQVLGAVGFSKLVQHELEVAVECLREARECDPRSWTYARDHAAAALELGNYDEALEAIDAALAAQDADPDAHLVRATILAALGRDRDAIDASRNVGTWEGDLLGAALADRGAVHRSIGFVEEETHRGALTSLVLASHEAAQGSLRGASRLASIAQSHAAIANEPWLVSAARDLYNSIEDRSGPVLQLRLRSSVDHATNPAYAARGREPRQAGLRLAMGAGGRLSIPIGPSTAEVGANIDQHVFLTERDTLSRYDISALTVTGAVRFPLSAHPSLAVLGISARFVDVFGDRFKTHFATSIEGGPDLTLELAAGLRLRLGLYGIASDVVDTSPPDSVVSSLNRDRVGQRASVTLFGEIDRIAAVFSAAFLHDDALGDAFDAVGGAASGRLIAYPTRDIELFTSVGVTLRQFGPVGDLAIIGPAATRTQLRIVAEIGARVALGGDVFLVVQDTWVDNQARDGHEYVENVLSIGAEVQW